MDSFGNLTFCFRVDRTSDFDLKVCPKVQPSACQQYTGTTAVTGTGIPCTWRLPVPNSLNLTHYYWYWFFLIFHLHFPDLQDRVPVTTVSQMFVCMCVSYVIWNGCSDYFYSGMFFHINSRTARIIMVHSRRCMGIMITKNVLVYGNWDDFYTGMF